MNKTITTKLADGEVINFTLAENEDDLYSIVVNNNKEEIASIWFKLKNRTCYLNRIEITQNSYARKGIGTMLIKCMESFAVKHYCFSVDGRFYPFGDLGQHARAFYTKNGYNLYKDGYETYICKTLDKNLSNEKTF